MTSWFYDVSNHQSTTPSLDGWDGIIVKASEGSGFKDGRFWQHINAARAAGKAHAGYHFLRSDSPVRDQAETFMSVCPPDIAAVPDVEWIKDNGGRLISAPTLAQTREFVDRLLQRGYHVPMQYLPRWYWNYWGQPDLSGLPALWGSYYPDLVARSRAVAWSMIPDSAKQGFGGLPMVAVQFTSTPLDQNRSELSPEQLYSFLSTTQRGPGGGAGRRMKEKDMILVNGDAGGPEVYAVGVGGKRHIETGEELDAYLKEGLTVHTLPQKVLDNIPTVGGLLWNYGIPVEDVDNPTVFRPAHRVVAGIYDSVADVVADVDEAALAAEMKKQGIGGGATAAQVKQAVVDALANTRLTPAPSTAAQE